MARIRTVKPSFFSSLSNADLPIPARLTFIGLWTYVDDKGRGVDDARLVKAAVWPLDEAYTTKKVEADLVLLDKAEKIGRYVVDGQRYLAVRKWKHQRIDKPQASILPAAPWEEDSGNVPGILPPDDRHRPGARPPKAGGEVEWNGSGREVEGNGPDVDPSRNHQVGLAIVGNGEMDQPQEPPPPRLPDPIVERLLTAWPEARRRKLAGAALAVVAEARRWLDAGLIDEVVGHMLAMAPPPGTPRYLLTVAPDWAQQRGANLSAEALASMAAAAKLPTERAAS